jgi:hypothetical protein
MRRIKFSNGDEFACDNEGYGVFKRSPDGSWSQWTGTGQTPKFRNPSALSRYIRRTFEEAAEELKGQRIVESAGW